MCIPSPITHSICHPHGISYICINVWLWQLQGRGPAAARCGLSKCMFRPSDDAVFLPFLVPANAMAAVELRHLAIITSSPTLPSSSSSALGAPNPLFAPDLAQRASVLAGQLEEALSLHAQVSLEGGRLVYAYEVDCFGGRVLMDDANIPSLLSLPYLGFVDRADPVYQATRALVLSPQNPFFFQGSAGEGIGGPHVVRCISLSILHDLFSAPHQ